MAKPVGVGIYMRLIKTYDHELMIRSISNRKF